MLTQNEITSLSLSPTKKDFVQIWNELLEVAGKLSERWDPTSTNESDPGIVILKALAGIADKLNYNIDKNILEAFMPTAAQEDSMRKLCDMLGYNMKYYRSAETEVSIKYYNSDPSEEEAFAMAAPGQLIPKFTVITNSDQDISYFTLDTQESAYYISSEASIVKIPCMEGQVVKCESSNDNNLITANQVQENNRFYLPETQIAENGIFIYNAIINSGTGELADGEKWVKVDNLNVQARDSRVFKFGFDSYESRPYIEFPEGYSKLFNEGIFIYYARTSGVNGNVSPKTLTQIELPTIGDWSNVTAESISVENVFAATTGANAETIRQAYNNFKKTIGTFETLVTCRDYMNKIYSFVESNRPLVSNILVTDIRNDLNRAITICSCDDSGIFYKETCLSTGSNTTSSNTAKGNVEQLGDIIESAPEIKDEVVHQTEEKTYIASIANKPFFGKPYQISIGDSVLRATSWHLGAETGMPIFNDEYSRDLVADTAFIVNETGEVSEYTTDGTRSEYWLITQKNADAEAVTFTSELPINWIESNEIIKTKTVTEQVTKTINNLRVDTITKEVNATYAIDHFDLVFYPFKSYNQIKSNVKDIRAVYDSSFTYTDSTLRKITDKLAEEEIKTISHNISTPRIGDVLSINNYLRLNATIATNSKVTIDEGNVIIDNIKKALANAFNMRELDFGTEIPFDSIVEVIENADTRIKVASLNEPALFTTFSVLEGKDNNNPVVTEYAVASDWLDADMAEKIGRFTKTDKIVNEDGTTEDVVISTFDTKTARQIYNKLAIRNILSGRVPLFDYNNAFKASFSEGVYQVTKTLQTRPYGLAVPTKEDPYTIWTNNNIIYTGQLDAEDKITYTETAPVFEDNLITECKNDDGVITDYITDISANCKLFADDSGSIADVTLADGEFVKFRAPNFITTKTYPAYVNYHLDLARELHAEAEPAEATSLFNILESDRKSWTADSSNVKWQKVLDYFGNIDAKSGTTYKKNFTVAQKVSAFISADTNEATITLGSSTTTIGVGVNNTPIKDTEYTPELLMTLSGCIKLTNKNFKARVEWTPAEGETKPAKAVPLVLVLEDFTNPFITNINVISELKTAIDTALATYRTSLPKECAQCSFTVYLDFECVPFEAKSLAAWDGFIRSCLENFDNKNFKYQVLDFAPYEENSTLFWRMYGDGYDIGKYVNSDTEKLLKFSKNYFGLLANNATNLHGIYIVKNIGTDAKPVIIKNNEEYKLGRGESLYIEYTPSTTTEEGTTKDLPSVTEIYGEGTIIRPSGFETGLFDSAVFTTMGNTPHKTVTFTAANSNAVTKNMHRFGANEQVEIRDFAKVTLSKDTLASIFIYKNFNGCPELEEKRTLDNNAKRRYTLKDGEAIFYTDQNKSEFAYYTSGTEVILEGKMTIGEFDIIELSTIFDSGPQVIPWKQLTFEQPDDKITFQEFQYITLGAEDTLNSITVLDSEAETDDLGAIRQRYLGSDWRFCTDVEYTLASDPSTTVVLPAINLQGDRDGNGWEACSTLELDVSSSVAQTLRSTDKIDTSLTLLRTNVTGGPGPNTTISAKHSASGDDSINTLSPMLFKTNLACQACGSEINIKDVWSNPNKLKGFQLKVFAQDEPVVVKTKPGKVIPYEYTGDLTGWSGESLEAKEYLDIWSQVNLENIKAAYAGSAPYDKALRLSVSLLPNTYGIFCIYIKYTSTTAKAKTWIEVVPGTDVGDVSLLNTDTAKMECLDANNKKLAKLYLNPGINCIRVNKNSRIFIKSSNDTQGILYFDELRLVNSLPIKYTDADKATVTLNTQGLNLTQLGYLNVSEANSGSISIAAKARLQKAYVEELYSEINSVIQETDEKFISDYAKLTAILPKVQELVSIEKDVKADIKAIKAIDEDRFIELAEQYKEASNKLEKEKALLNALNNNVKAEELEQQLVDLLDSFASIETSKQQILEELAVLRSDAETAAKNLSNTDILADFDSSILEHVSAISDIKAIVLNKIEEHYQEQLNDISSKIDRYVNSEGKGTLLDILEKLKATATSTIRAELQAKVSELRNLVENDIDVLVEDIVETAYQEDEPDYQRLLMLLVRLRNTVDSTNIKAVVSELEQAISESDDEQLKALLVPFFKNGTFNINTSINSDIISKIDDVYTAATKTIDKDYTSADKATATKDKVNTLKGTISDKYNEKLKTIFNALNSALTSLSNETEKIDEILASISAAEYSEVIDSSSGEAVDVGKNSQVRLAIDQLNSIISERAALIDGYDRLDSNSLTPFEKWRANDCAKYIEEAIIIVWPALFAARSSVLLDHVDTIFSDTFAGDLVSFSTYEDDLKQLYEHETDVMKAVLNTSSLKKLFDKIKPLLSIDAQNKSNAELIQKIGGLVSDTEELSNAIKASSNNKVLSDLIKELSQTTDIKQKQKIQLALKEALEDAKSTSERLFNVIASILCPNLTKHLAGIDESDGFYAKLRAKLKEIESSVIAKDRKTFGITVDSAYLKLLELPLNSFKTGLETFKTPDSTLLPDDVIATFNSLSSTLEATAEQANDVIILDGQPLDTMSSAELSSLVVVKNPTIVELLYALCKKIEYLEGLAIIDADYEKAFNTLKLEEQLLADIKAIDLDRDFYYNAPIATSMAIELNESTNSLNTLMNPRMYYDINNVNNCFVISKLDIDFLDGGLKIARSSRLN